MFEFLFKYPAAVFAKGQFVFLASWPLWLLALLLVGRSRRRSGHPLRNREAPKLALRAGGRPVGAAGGFSASSPDAVAAGAQRLHPAPASEYRRRGRGRFAQHGRPRTAGHAGAMPPRGCSIPGCSNRLNERFQVRLYRTSSGLDRIAGTQQLNAAGLEHPSRRGAAADRRGGRRACRSVPWCC